MIFWYVLFVSVPDLSLAGEPVGMSTERKHVVRALTVSMSIASELRERYRIPAFRALE